MSRRITRAEYEAARRLYRHVCALLELPPSLPVIAQRYCDVSSRKCFGEDPLTVPIARRLNDFKNAKDIPF